MSVQWRACPLRGRPIVFWIFNNLSRVLRNSSRQLSRKQSQSRSRRRPGRWLGPSFMLTGERAPLMDTRKGSPGRRTEASRPLSGLGGLSLQSQSVRQNFGPLSRGGLDAAFGQQSPISRISPAGGPLNWS